MLKYTKIAVSLYNFYIKKTNACPQIKSQTIKSDRKKSKWWLSGFLVALTLPFQKRYQFIFGVTIREIIILSFKI